MFDRELNTPPGLLQWNRSRVYSSQSDEKVSAQRSACYIEVSKKIQDGEPPRHGDN